MPASNESAPLSIANEAISDTGEGTPEKEVMPGYSADPSENHLVSYYDFQKAVLFKNEDPDDTARTWGINRASSSAAYAKMVDAVNATGEISFGEGTDVTDSNGDKASAPWNQFNWDEDNGLNVSYAVKNNQLLTKALLLDGTLNTAENGNFTVSFTLSSKHKYGKTEEYENDGKNTTGRDQILYIGPLNNPDKNYVSIYRDSSKSDSRLKIGSGKDGKTTIFTMKHFETILGLNKGNTPTPITYTLTFERNEDGKTNVKVYRDGRITRGISESDTVDNTNTNIELPADCRVILGGLTDSYDGQDLYVDNVYIFDKTLSSGEVKNLYKFQSDENVQNTGETQAQPWTAEPAPDPTETPEEPETDGLLYFSANANGSATALLQNQILNTPEKDRTGWYYVTSTSQWANILAAGTAKTMDALRNDIKIDGEAQPYYYDGYELEDPDATAEGKLNSEIAPEGTPAGGYYYYQPTGFEPLKFFLDEQGHLCCFYSSGNATMDANGWSHVYAKKNTTRIKSEVLQHALGRFVTKLSENTPGSSIGAVRFSTQRYSTSDDTFEKHPEEYNKFNLLNWTSDAQEAISILSGERGDGSDPNGVTANDEGQYNYVLTGNTSTAAGFKTYEACLAAGVDDDSATKKYLIVFTDGKDTDYDAYKTNLQEHPAVKEANTYREGENEYTIIAVMLAGGTVQEGSADYNSALTFLASLTGEYTADSEGEEDLKAPANKDDEGKGKYRYVYVGHSSDEIEDVFETIGEEIADDLDNYYVKDYIDPRFNLVDAYGSVWKLENNGSVTIEKTADSAAPETEYKDFTPDEEDANILTKSIVGNAAAITLRSDSKIEGSKSKLRYDDLKSAYYLDWSGQRIPGSSAGDTILPVWNAQITIKAKDDFIGGNTVLTNGDAENENFVYPDMKAIKEARPGDRDDVESSSGTTDSQRNPQTGSGDVTNYPSKGFPRTTVNVDVTKLEIEDGRQVLFMGEELTNEDVAKKLGDNVNGEWYWKYLKRYAEYKKAEYAPPEGYEPFDMLIKELVTTAEKTYPYYYIPDDAVAGADVEQIGTLTFKWQDITGKDPADEADGTTYVSYPTDNGITNDLSPRRSKLTVQYTPNEREIVVEDTEYGWDKNFKPADGTNQPATDDITGSYTTNIVSGEIAFEMKLSADVVEYLQTYAHGQTVTYKANLVKKEDSGAETVIGTYTAEYKVPDEPDVDLAEVTVPAEIVYNNEIYTNYGLPMGNYAVKPIEGSGFGITFGNVENVTLTSADASGFNRFDASATKKAAEIIDPSTVAETHTVDEFAAEIDEDGTIKIGGTPSDESDYRDKRYAMAKIGASINKYTVEYDMNGGEGTVPPEYQGIEYALGEEATLWPAEAADVTKGDAVFLGWSLDKHEDSLASQDEEDAAGITDTVTVNGNMTVHAVWAIDVKGGPKTDPKDPEDPSNPNEVPDYKQVTLTYDANGGEGNVPPVTYYKGDKAELVTVEDARGKLNRTGAVFIGWSLEQHEGIIKSQEEENEAGIIPEIASITDNTTVYAVWAVDVKGGDGENPDPNKPVEPEDNPSNPNGIEDYKQATLTYNANGGEGKIPPVTMNIGEPVELVTVEDARESLKLYGAVLIGWSLEPHEGIIKTKAEEDAVDMIEDETLTLDEDITVYAVWAVDEKGGDGNDPDPDKPIDPEDNPTNPSDIPDYLEYVTLTYDANGAESGTVPASVSIRIGEDYKLDGNEGELTRRGLAFAGWSLDKTDEVVKSIEEANAIVVDVVEDVQADTVVYAVWAVDDNSTHIPDYNEEHYSITYDGNGNTEGEVPVDNTLYLEGTNVLLADGSSLLRTRVVNEETGETTADVFVGWSLEPITEAFTAEQGEEVQAVIITSYVAEDDTVVYAVWAEDLDGNGKPDYAEDSYHVVYYGNGGLFNDTSENYTDSRYYLTGSEVRLMGVEEASMLTREGAVLIGWSYDELTIFDEEPDEDVIVYTVTVEDKDAEVYAVWAKDSNGNKIPDYKEFSVQYDLNGGDGTVPDSYTRLYSVGDEVSLWKPEAKDAPQREGAVFVGWSAEQYPDVFTERPADGVVIDDFKAVMPESGMTVYAVWAEDVNGNDIPDYEENKYAVTYDFNGGSGVVPDKFLEEHFEGEKIVLWQPESEDAPQMDNAVFLGWSKEAHEIFTNAPADGVIIETVVSAEGVTVYAVWAIDENGDHIPDYVKTYHTVTYEWAKPASAPDKAELPEAQIVEDGAEFTPAGVSKVSGYTFGGWYTEPDCKNKFTNGVITMDITLYGKWTKNSSGGGGGNTTPRYTITSKAGEGGSIDPEGEISYYAGSDATYTITPGELMVVDDVIVDGESVGVVGKYTFTDIRADHAISVTFKKRPDDGVPIKPITPTDTGVSDHLDTVNHILYLIGYPDRSFGPSRNMTRAEAAQMFYNLLKDNEIHFEPVFEDVPSDVWYAKAVYTLAEIGIVEGVGENRFEPDRCMTRAEFTTMAMRFAGLDVTGENIYNDVFEDDWYNEYIVKSTYYGWMKGYDDGSFRPNNLITRAEVTTVVNRMLNRVADESYVNSHKDELVPFTDLDEEYWAYLDIVEATNPHDYIIHSESESWTRIGE